MDELISRFEAIPEGDLMICEGQGVAYQRDMAAGRIVYGDDYLAKFEAYDLAIAAAVNAGRCKMLARHLPRSASVLDVGAGDGGFVRAVVAAGFDAKGFDVIPRAADELRRAGLYAHPLQEFDAVTLWDVIEHLEEPASWILNMRKRSWLFVSLPIFGELSEIRSSKHYRPGEHLYYWTKRGFVNWLLLYGFVLLEKSAHETHAGREGVYALAFRRGDPGSL